MQSAKRGFTLLEMLLAFALLSSLIVGASGWLSATRVVSEHAGELRWRIHAERLVTAIAEELRVADQPESLKRVSAEGGTLTIAGRRGAVASYHFDAERGTVQRGESPAVLLGDLRSVEFLADSTTRTLVIELASETGALLEREVSW